MRLESVTPEMLNPPALIQAQFDEEHAIADIKAAVGRRDEHKSGFQDAILIIGRKLIEARRAMPGQIKHGKESYSPAFCAFFERCGLSRNMALTYMSFARQPERLQAARKRWNQYEGQKRRRVLEEVLDLLAHVPDKDTAVQIIREELNEIK